MNITLNKSTNAQQKVCRYAGGRNSNRHLNNHQLISGGRNSFRHLFLTSTLVILFGFGSWLDIVKCQHSSKPDALGATYNHCDNFI